MLRKVLKKTSLISNISDIDKKILTICNTTGNIDELISILKKRIDIDVNAKHYVINYNYLFFFNINIIII